MGYGDWANEHGLIGLGIVSGWNSTPEEAAQQEALARLNALGGNSYRERPLLSEEQFNQLREQAEARGNQPRGGQRQDRVDQQLSGLSYDDWVASVMEDPSYTQNYGSGRNVRVPENMWGNVPFGVTREQYEAAQAQGADAMRDLLGDAQGVANQAGFADLDPLAIAQNVSGSVVPRFSDMRQGRAGAMSGQDALHPSNFETYEEYEQAVAADNAQRQRDSGLEVEDPRFQTLMQDSAMSEAAGDPLGVEAQRAALRGMQDIYEQGGYTESERAQMRQAQMSAASYEQSQRAAQLQQMEMRGLSGSGIEAMMRSQAGQEGANRAASSADQIAIEGQRRALAALDTSGQMGSSLRAQSFQEDAARRAAIDYVNQSNTQYQQGVQQRNVDRQYTAAGAQMGQSNYMQQQAQAEQAQRAGMTAGIINTGLAMYTGGASAAATGALNATKGRRPEEEEEPQY